MEKPRFKKTMTAAQAQGLDGESDGAPAASGLSTKPVFRRITAEDATSTQTTGRRTNRETGEADARSQRLSSAQKQKELDNATTALSEAKTRRDTAEKNYTMFGQPYYQEYQDAKAAVKDAQKAYEDAGGEPSLGSRLKNILTGGTKQSVAGNTDAMGVAYQAGQEQRNQQNQDNIELSRKAWEQQQRTLDDMLAEGGWSEKEIESQRAAVEWTRKIYESYAGAEGIQQQAGEASRDTAVQIAQSGEKDLDKAKQGLGTLGQMAVDAGASTVQMGLDIGANAVLGANPNAMLPFAARAFGGGTMTARANGADLGQQVRYGGAMAAKEVLTEKMFSAALPFAKAYGGGSLDGVVESAISKAVDRFAGTEAGKKVLGGILSYGAGAIGEGLEELIGDWMEWQMPRIYGGDPATAEETLQDSLYDFLVGTMAGGIGVDQLFTYDVSGKMRSGSGVELTGADREVFGTQGQKVLDTVMRSAQADGTGTAEGYAAFSRAYTQGVQGKELSETGLSRQAAELAYYAGKEDGETQRETGKFANANNTESGLVLDDYVRENLDLGQVQTLNDTAKALGVRVQFTDSMENGAQGKYEKGTVLIAKDAPDPLKQVYGHEITHRMQELAPTEYAALREAVQAELGDTLENEVQKRIRLYARHSVKLSYEEALDEVTADYAGELIRDGQALEDFIQRHRENRTLLEKLRDAIRGLISKLTGKEQQQVRTAEERLSAALDAAAKQAEKNTARVDGAQRFSIKRTSQMTLSEQLKMFYDGKMASSDAFYFGETPDTLAAAGLDPLPLAFTVADFRKSAKEKHNVPRRVWENLHESLENALFAFRLGDRVGIMTDDIDGDGKPLLVGIERNAVMDRKPVNAIRSVYGLDNPGPWLQNQFKSGKEYIPLNKQRADAFFQTYGAYSASVGDGIRSMDGTVTQKEPESNGKFSVSSRDMVPEEIKKIQSIGRKSVNELTSDELKKVEPFARRYWAGMKEKSPFFRAWFGDWRANDHTPVQVVKADRSAQYKAGKSVNEDTGWIISWGDRLKGETRNHGTDEEFSLIGDIGKIVRNSVLLDTFTSEVSSKNKMPGTALMHSFYAIVDDGSGTGVYKLFVEEAISVKSGEPFTRAYELKSIKKSNISPWGVLSAGREGLTHGEDVTKINVAELFQFVKENDSAFHPVEASKIVDEDGKPLVVYHGTDADFTVFDSTKTRSRMDIQGSFFSPWEDDAMGYGGKVGSYYLNIKNPADGRTAYRALRRFQGQNDAGKQAREYLIRQGYDGVDNNGEEYIAFYPEQIKSATENTGAFDRSDPDIRYSIHTGSDMVDAARLRQENELLRERVEYWEGQTRRSKGATTDKKAVQQAARGLIQDIGAELDVGEVSAPLQELYDYLAGNGGGEGIIYEDAYAKAKEIAGRLVDSAVMRDDSLYQQYGDLREYLKDTKIVVPEEVTRDIPDFEQYRKKQFGRMTISTRGKPNLDQVFSELSTMYPEFFDQDETVPASDQLERIVEVAGEIYAIYEENPYRGQRDSAVTGVANEIMERFFDLPQTRATFADRADARLRGQRATDRKRLDALRAEKNQKMEQLRQENRKKLQDRVEKERKAREKEVTALRSRYADNTEKGRERRKAAELRRKILRHASKLDQRLQRPTDKQNIPEHMRSAVAGVLNCINRESAFEWMENGDGTTRRVQSGTEPGAQTTKKTEAFRALRDSYRKIMENEDCDLVIDPDLFGDGVDKGLFEQLVDLGDTPINSMDSVQLDVIWKVLRSVEHSITMAGKTLSRAKYERTSQWAEALQRDSSSRRRKRAILAKHRTLDMMDPYTFFSSYGESGMAVYRMLRDAQDSQAVKTGKLAEQVQRIVDTDTVQQLQKQRHSFTTERGEKLTLTTGQIMNLYNLSRREQAQEHLMEGGIMQPAIARNGLEPEIRRGNILVKLSAGDLETILGTLTTEQTQIAESLQKLTTSTLADWGNEASMTAYGYRKFTERDYWPIKSAEEEVHSNTEKSPGNVRSIRNIGLAKNIKPHANNGVDCGDIFDVFASHAADMIDYSTWLCPMEDANRLFNFRYRDDTGETTGMAVKGLLDYVGGEKSQNYWQTLMDNIQNGIMETGTETDKTVARLVGNTKGAAVGGNLRVVIQQPTAFFRAAAVLNPVNLMKGAAGGVTRGSGWEKALKWAPIARIKDVGGFDQGSARSVAQQLYGVRTGMEKLSDTMTWAARKTDAVTWGKLWNACEYETQEQHPELQAGSDSFYRKTAEIFTDLIDQTQVVDGVLQRAQNMRSGNEMAKQATSFMGEPLKSLNMMIRSWDQLAYEQDPAKRSKAIKRLGRTVTALVVTDVVNAAAQSLVDGIRDDDEDRKFWERFLTAFTGVEGDEETAMERVVNIVLNGNAAGNLNPLGRIPYVKDFLSVLQGYRVERMDASALGDVIDAATLLVQSLSGTGKYTAAYSVKKLLTTASKVFGVSIANLGRDAWGILRSIAVETDNTRVQYEMEKAIYSIGVDKNLSRFYDIMFRARETGDQETYDRIQGDLIQSGVTDAEQIEKAMRDRLKKSDAFIAAKDSTAGDLMETLENSRAWGEMEQDTREKALELLETYAAQTTMQDQEDGYDIPDLYGWVEDAQGGTAVGLTPVEYILYKAALEAVSTGGGTLGQSAFIDALDGMDWLTDRERDYLFSQKYESQKNNPYK